MRKTVRRWWWVCDFEREERWLNQMAAEGWALCGTGFCRYDFETCEPGEYTLRLELMEHQPGSTEGQDYIRFLEETGAEQVGSYMRWVYFRKKSALGSFDIFSDLDSRIAHLGRILRLLLIVGLLNFGIGLQNLCLFLGQDRAFNSVGLVNLSLAALLFYGAWRLYKKRGRLCSERQIFE